MLAQYIPSGASHLNAIMVFWQKTWHAPEVQLLHKIANLQILYLDTPPDAPIIVSETFVQLKNIKVPQSSRSY